MYHVLLIKVHTEVYSNMVADDDTKEKVNNQNGEYRQETKGFGPTEEVRI